MRQFWVLLNFFLLGVAYSLCSVGLWGWGAHGVAAVLGDEGHSSPSTGSTAASFKHDAYGNSSAAGSMIYRGPRRTSLLNILAGVAAAAAIAAVAFLLFRCFVSLKHSVASAAGRHLAERGRSCEVRCLCTVDLAELRMKDS